VTDVCGPLGVILLPHRGGAHDRQRRHGQTIFRETAAGPQARRRIGAELMETGRAIQRRLASADRTILIASDWERRLRQAALADVEGRALADTTKTLVLAAG
jgi:hypothetical protein